MRRRLGRFIRDRAGASAIEYAFIAALISVVLVAAATGVGPELATVFSNVDAGLKKGG
jgi:pilus assembly protein Flp/PilA